MRHLFATMMMMTRKMTEKNTKIMMGKMKTITMTIMMIGLTMRMMIIMVTVIIMMATTTV